MEINGIEFVQIASCLYKNVSTFVALHKIGEYDDKIAKHSL